MSKFFAVIQDNIVVNTIVADTLAIAQDVTGLSCVEYSEDDTPQIGFGYDGTVFEQPAPDVEEV